MSWLLDTHSLIWALFEPGKLGRKARDILKDSANDVRVSPISYWEISLKSGLGKLALPGTDPSDIPASALELGLREDPLDSQTLSTIHLLPSAPDHRDPFDRLLIWHAIRHKHTLISKDRALPFFRTQGLKTVW